MRFAFFEIVRKMPKHLVVFAQGVVFWYGGDDGQGLV